MKPSAFVGAMFILGMAALFAQQKASPDTTSKGKEKLPDPTSLGVLGTSQQASRADTAKKDTVKKEELPDPQLPAMELRQQAMPEPEKMGQPMEKKIKMPLKRKKKVAADTSAGHKALEAKNRALFEQLFGDTPM